MSDTLADHGAQLPILNATLSENSTAGNDTEALYHEPTEEELQHSIFIFYTVMFVMIFAQSALVNWRKRHRKSYELVTLLGLWLIPFIVSIQFSLWRFLAVWLVYSSVTAFFLYQCTMSRTIDKMLPKRIYRWFLGVFKTSVALGVVGYSLLVVEIFGAGVTAGGPILDPGFAVVLVWYGLYFGILSRDCAEVASDRIASRLNTQRRLAVSVRDCAICGGELADAHLLTVAQASTAVTGPGDDGPASVQLECKHIFHTDCIRGWLIVGKKDACPTCSEKVDLRALYAGKPWETRNLSWIQMLDMVRYLVVWQPTILMALHLFFHALHLDEDVGGGGDVMGDGNGGNGTALVNATIAIQNSSTPLNLGVA